MRTMLNLPALAYAFRVGCGYARRDWAGTLGNCLYFGAVAVSYNALVHAIPVQKLTAAGLTADRMIWYAMLTDLMSMAMGTKMHATNTLVKEGGVEVLVARPVSFWTLLLSERVGEAGLQLVFVVPVAILLGFWFTGAIPFRLADLLVIPSMCACVVCAVTASLVCGCLGMWVRGTEMFWTFQKFVVIGGGMFWPIALYPPWLRSIVWLTPLPVFAGLTGNFAFGFPFPRQMAGVTIQILWVVILMLLMRCVAVAMYRKIGGAR